MRIASGVTDQYVYFVAVDATDFTTRETGLSSFTVNRSRNGGARAAMTTPTINQTNSANMPGVYELLLDEDMTIGSGNETEAMAFHITHSGMAPVTLQIELFRPKITAGYTLGVESDGDLTKVNTLNGHTAQTGDTYALANGATGFAAIDTVVDGVQADLSNGTDGLGALKALIDALQAVVDTAAADVANIDGAAMRGTDSAYTGTPPTSAAIADAVLDEAMSGHVVAGSLGKSIADIEADTNELQTDDIPGTIAALNNLSAANVATELATYDGPTKAEMDSAFATTDGLIGTVDTVVDLTQALAAGATGFAAIDTVVDTINSNVGTNGAALSDLGGMSVGMKAEVNAEALDVLNVDAYAEPGQEVPAATSSIANKINYLFKAWRNRSNQTATTYQLFADDGTTVDQKATVSDDATTAEKGEIATGP